MRGVSETGYVRSRGRRQTTTPHQARGASSASADPLRCWQFARHQSRASIECAGPIIDLPRVAWRADPPSFELSRFEFLYRVSASMMRRSLFNDLFVKFRTMNCSQPTSGSFCFIRVADEPFRSKPPFLQRHQYP